MTKLAELAGAVPGAAVAVLCGALIYAPLASADPTLSGDEQRYVSDLDSAGLVNEAGPKAAVESGWQICSDLNSGVSGRQVAIQLAQASASTPSAPGDHDLTLGDAEQFVVIAMTDLCPSTS